MIFLFYIFAALLIYFSYKSFRGGVEYLNYFKLELSKALPNYTPFATIFVPCRGVDQGMLENLDALLMQDYREFEIVFILDDENDGAAQTIEAAWQEARRPVKLVVAPKATDSSQKVANFREGVLYADPRSEIFVFADSDARPQADWLRYLIAPLTERGVGAATGYRWFISSRRTFSSEMRAIWNASIASALGPNRESNFCWGGSTAIRREVFERLDIRERWNGTLSDDFTVTRIMNEAGLDIVFVPQALIPSIEDCKFGELIEFTTRQMKITRVYSANLWLMSLLGSALFCLVITAAIVLAITRSVAEPVFVASLVTLLAVTLFSVGKSWYRLRAVRLVMPQYKSDLGLQTLSQLTLWAITPVLFLYNCTMAMISRTVRWRGTSYEMVSATETRILER